MPEEKKEEDKKKEGPRLPWLKKKKETPILRGQKENKEIQEFLRELPMSKLEEKLVEKMEKEEKKRGEEKE